MTNETHLSATAQEPTVEDGEFLTLDEAVQFLGTSKATLYRWLGQGDLKGMKVGRQWRFRKGDLVAYMERGPVAAATPPAEALEAELDYFAEQLRQFGSPDTLEFEEEKSSGRQGSPESEETTQEGKMARLIRRILALAVSRGASYIHLEPARQGSDAYSWLRFRHDFVLHTIRQLPVRMHDGLILHLKQLAEMNLAERRVPQDGRIPFWYEGNAFDLRVSCLPTLFGEAITMRIVDKQRVRIGLDQLGLTPEDLARLHQLIYMAEGLLLTSGPADSGRTMLLYSCINALARSYHTTLPKICTIEDPVEVALPFATQTQVNRKAGMTYAAALRAFARQDPDIILLGEMRDPESAQLLMEMAITGKLALSTVHTPDAASVLLYLRDMGVEPFLITQAVSGVVAQRLARKVCAHCKESTTALLPDTNPALHQRMLEAAAAGGYTLPSEATFARGHGCQHCFLTGYKDCIGVFEVMVMTPEIKHAFLHNASALELSQIAVAQGMRTLLADGLRKAAEGLTTPEEVFRAARG